jgi:beta-galactosidase
MKKFQTQIAVWNIKKKSFLPKSAILFCAAAAIFLVGCLQSSASVGRQVEGFDFDWKYHEGDLTNAQAVGFDDHDWQAVQLPHDASIGRVPVNEGGKSGRWNGFVPRSIGWYRKNFAVTNSLGRDRLAIDFEGVYRNAEVWLNGDYLGRWPNGFLDFSIDLTDHVRSGDNVLAVRYDNTFTNSSRWYMGEGIYRHVWLERLAPVHVEHDGQFISTPEICSNSATVKFETEICNQLPTTTNAEVLLEILSPEEQVVANLRGQIPISGNGRQTVRQQVSLKNPELWDITNPNLYSARTTIKVGGQTVDQVEEKFGIRQISFSPEHGLALNGRKVFLNGVNLHDDLPGVGTAALDRAIEHRLETMKSLGVNAVRFSHNPHAKHFLDTCDRLGLLVFDEAYDKWSNQYYGPNETFAAHWQKDLEAFVRRDRNHPSVFIWSVGNEPEGQQKEGPDDAEVVLLSQMIQRVKALDPGRPVTAALYPARWNGIKWNQKGYYQSQPHQLAFLQEVTSVNYQSGFFGRDGKAFPQMIWLLSEASTTGWGDGYFTYNHEPVVGQFYWGGADYLGECERWPQRGWYRGLVEWTDFFKPQSYYIQSFYSTAPMVHIAVFNSSEKSSAVWNDVSLEWQKMYDSWNFQPGENVEIATFSNAEEVELFLNGRSLGIKKMADCPKQKMIWKLSFELGELKAVAKSGGKEVATHVIQTAGASKRIQLEADRTTIQADGADLAFIRFKVVDDRGVQCPVNSPVIRFEITGPGSNAGVASGDMSSLESYQANQRCPWQGDGLLVVRSARQAGEIVVKAFADGLEPATLFIHSQ